MVVAGLLVCGLGGVSAAKVEAQVTLELTAGTRARYLVSERLVGVNLNNPASGLTEAVTGAIVIKADGTIDATKSKITVDMRTFKSDQAIRDMYIQGAVLDTKQYPMLEFVPSRAEGLPNPLPSGTPYEVNPKITIPSAVGFKLIGNMTFHGVTKEATWTVVTTLLPDAAAGTANTTVTFATFGLTKPAIPVLASVEDNIRLEIEFRAKRTAGM
jgi:polyisoprenoid-binding protein YceI